MMKRRWISALCALCLMALTIPAALAANPSDLPSNSGGTDSIQMMFAKLQMELAQTSRSAAQEAIGQVQESQAGMKEATGCMNQLRELRAQARQAEQSGKTPPTLPGELQAFLDKHGIYYGSAAQPDYDSAISGTGDYLDQLSTDTQMQMIYIQDYMSQYNSYLNGAANSISQSGQTLQSLARGGSLFSTDGAVTTQTAPVALSALAGAAAGMALMWLILKVRQKGGDQGAGS